MNDTILNFLNKAFRQQGTSKHPEGVRVLEDLKGLTAYGLLQVLIHQKINQAAAM